MQEVDGQCAFFQEVLEEASADVRLTMLKAVPHGVEVAPVSHALASALSQAACHHGL